MARIPGQGRKFTPPQWGGGGGGPLPGAAGGSSSPQSSSPSPTGWVNVQNYLNANRSQADAMGQNLAGQIEKEAEPAVAAAEKYRADANAYANAPKEKRSPEYDKWVADYSFMLAGVGGDQKRMAEWYKKNGTVPPPMMTTATPGPAPSMPSSPGKVLEKINAAGTAGGRAEMLAAKAGPSYNAGQSNLDSYLAGAGAGGKALQGLGEKYGTVLNLVRYPFPGALPPGNRPPSPNEGAPEPGTVPLPEDKPFDPGFQGNIGVPGARPGDTRPGSTTITKRKRFA